MNRKDFDLIARAIRREYAAEERERTRAALAFAAALKNADACHGFDRTQFLRACAVDDVE